MALEASHIRFGLAIATRLEVHDFSQYVPGIIYPDSRYVTRIDRSLTHAPELLGSNPLHFDDFTKGCYAHLLYDELLRTYTLKTLSHLFDDIESALTQGNELWVRLTALKILQDIDDAKNYAITEYLPYLNTINAINGESSSVLQNYNNYFQNMYAIPHQLAIPTYYEMWKFLGIGDTLASKVIIQTERYSHNETIIHFLRSVYQSTLEMSEEFVL